MIHSGLSYPFAMVFHANHFYFTDWRRWGSLPYPAHHFDTITILATGCINLDLYSWYELVLEPTYKWRLETSDCIWKLAAKCRGTDSTNMPIVIQVLHLWVYATRGDPYCDLYCRDAIISMSKGTSQFTDDYLPEQRSHLYGIAVASPSCL